MSVHVHSQHKALTKYAIYKCIFPACGLPLDSLNSEFRKQVFFIVMLSNLSVFPPWIMLLVLCLKIGGKFMAPRSFPSAAPPLPQQMGLKRWENQEYGRILDPLTALSCVCVWVFSWVWLIQTPWTAAHQASVSVGLFQARVLEGVAISSLRGSSPPRDWTRVSHVSCVSYISKQILYHCTTWEALS